jgi:hypothetical protein
MKYFCLICYVVIFFSGSATAQSPKVFTHYNDYGQVVGYSTITQAYNGNYQVTHTNQYGNVTGYSKVVGGPNGSYQVTNTDLNGKIINTTTIPANSPLSQGQNSYAPIRMPQVPQSYFPPLNTYGAASLAQRNRELNQRDRELELMKKELELRELELKRRNR